MRKQFTLLVLMCMSILSLCAQDFSAVNEDGVTINYTVTSVDDKTVAVGRCYNVDTDVLNIPSKVEYSGETYTVTSISDLAFVYNSIFTTVNIPNTVIEIGERAFGGCTGLTSITIPDSVVKIGRQPFSWCTNLAAFYGKFVSDDNRCLIVDDALIAFAPVGLTSYSIPNSVTRIGEYAFCGSSELVSIEFPESIKEIGDLAFYECSGLTSVTIPRNVEMLGGQIFSNLTSVQFNAINCNVSPSTYSGSPFAYCPNLTSITISDEVQIIGDKIFGGCSITSIDIPTSVTSIGYAAFSGSNLISINIPNSVTSIGESAFSNCRQLASVTIPKSVLSIGYYAFMWSSNLQEIKVENTDPANISLEEYVFPSSVTPTCVLYVPQGSKQLYQEADQWKDFENIEEFAVEPVKFSSENEEGVTIYYNITSEADKTVAVTSSDVINSGATKISHSNGNIAKAASDANEYTGTVNIPSSVEYLGETYTVVAIDARAFDACNSLASVAIPNSIKSIGDYAFGDCKNLQEVKVDNADPANIALGQDIFESVPTSTCVLSVPAGSTKLYAEADQWKDFTNIQEISGIQSILVDGDATSYTVIGIDGRIVMQATDEAALNNLPRGFYIVNGKKMMLK